MAKFATIRNNKVNSIYVSDAPLNADDVQVDDKTPEPSVGWEYDGEGFTYVEPTPISYGTRITKLAMSNRFTFDEEVAIEQTAETDAQVRVVLRKLNNASYIDLSLPQTEQLLNVLVSKALLTPERKTAILTDPVQADEVPS